MMTAKLEVLKVEPFGKKDDLLCNMFVFKK